MVIDNATIDWMRTLIVGASIAIFLGGCAIFEEQSDVQLDLDFSAVLPDGWQALRTWQEVSVDGDADVEFLLLFKFDNGQIGAVIYDPQSSSDYVGISDVPATIVNTGSLTVVTAPLQSFGFFRPYRLLPSYWSYTYGDRIGHGVVAMPADAGRVEVYDVPTNGSRGTTNGENDLDSGDSTGELLLRGGDTHITFAWWKGIAEGYGVTQLVAAGGFLGIDWTDWAENPEPIDRISGLYPVLDYRGRSLLCREVRFDRMATSEAVNESADSDAPLPASESPPTRFSETDLGLRFCQDPPTYPFYPEGVVMAYLAAHQNNRGSDTGAISGDHLVAPGTTPAQLSALLLPSLLIDERVADIETYATIPVSPANLQSGEFAPTTTVCVEMVGFTDRVTRRWLLFTLRYQRPDLAQRAPDRWSIADIAGVPRPVQEPEADYCRTILAWSQE